MIKAVIFDWDGVLLDSEPIFKRVEQSLLKEAWQQSSSSIGPDSIDEQIAQLIRAMSGMGTEPAMAMCHERLGLSLPLPELIREYNVRIERDYPQSPIVPHALDMVRRLIPHFKLGLATSSRRSLVDPALVATGAGPLFECTASADDVGGVAKPAPDVYLRVVELLQVPAHECIAVEDTPVGVQAAIAAGCRCIGIPHRETLFGDFQAATRVARTIQDITPEFLHHMDQAPNAEDRDQPVVVYARSQAVRRADALIHLQLEATASLARQRGYRIVDRLFDLDRGLAWADRPGLARAMQLAASGAIRRILVTEPTILDPAGLNQAHIVRELMQHNVSVSTVFTRRSEMAGARWN